jgi:hypothetical protein
MTSVRVPGFLPSTRGLHFPNAFPHVPNVQIDLPGGLTVAVGDAANGLCGGMAYMVRDLFEAGLSPPAMTTAPGDGPVFRYLADRLLDSLSLPFGPATYLKLMHPALPDGDLAVERRSSMPGAHAPGLPELLRTGMRRRYSTDARVHGRAWRMVRLEWPAIRGDLDRGILCPLGLVRTKSRDPRDLGANHQVLAWGYDLDGTRLTVALYDPNHPDDDDVTLSLDVGRPRRPTPVTSSRGGPVWCFFRTAYRFKDPRPTLTALRA